MILQDLILFFHGDSSTKRVTKITASTAIKRLVLIEYERMAAAEFSGAPCASPCPKMTATRPLTAAASTEPAIDKEQQRNCG